MALPAPAEGKGATHTGQVDLTALLSSQTISRSLAVLVVPALSGDGALV